MNVMMLEVGTDVIDVTVCRAGRKKEALCTAKEAAKCYPKNALAMCLVGQVHFHAPSHHDRAKRALHKALEVDPRCAKAAKLLAQVDTHGALRPGHQETQ